MGFAPLYLKIYPWFPFGELYQVINSYLDETPLFSCPSRDLTQAIAEQPSIIKVREEGDWETLPWAPWADPNVHVLFFGWADLSAPSVCLHQTSMLLSSLSGQVGKWAEGDCHGSACSFHHRSARLKSPQKVLLLLLLHSPSCQACLHGCSASAEADSQGERGCKPQTSLMRSQWLC